MTRRDAEKAVMNVALDTNFAIPGEKNFALAGFVQNPKDRAEAGKEISLFFFSLFK